MHNTVKGRILINTGNGKGKTTAALGTAFRAWGDGLRVLVLQFIKSGNGYGELKTAKQLPNFEFRSMGKGFLFQSKNDGNYDMGKHIKAAEEAWAMVEKEVSSGNWDLIVLDEIHYAIKYDLLDVERVEALLDNKPANLHIILTGRDAHPHLIERADTVTEMKEIKHAYNEGINATRGIEF